MASVDEINAGFDAARKTIVVLIDGLAPNKDYPFFGNPHVKAMEWLASPEGRGALLNEVSKILEAAEKVRAKGV